MQYGKWKKNETVSNHIAPNKFKYFKGGESSLEVKFRSELPSVFSYDALKCIIEENLAVFKEFQKYMYNIT